MKLFLQVIIILVFFSSCKKEENNNPYPFQEFAWGSNTGTTLLCQDAPVAANDTAALIDLNCMIEGDRFVENQVATKNELLLFTYNIERGHHAQEIIDLLKGESELAVPDIIFLSEVDRNCPQSFAGKNFARELADALDMYYVYGTEFFEVSTNCEIGNAILSKYPIGNVEFARFDSASTYYLYDDNGNNYRQGGRSYISGDIKIGEKYLRIYSTHLAAFFGDQAIREAQTKQMINHSKKFQHAKVIAGDFNSYLYSLSLSEGAEYLGIAQYLFDEGFEDTHHTLAFSKRKTNFSIIGLAIDLFFVKGVGYNNPNVGGTAAWDGLSDHNPSWVTIELE